MVTAGSLALVSGTVLDSSGAAVPGAYCGWSARLRDIAAFPERSISTDASGSILFYAPVVFGLAIHCRDANPERPRAGMLKIDLLGLDGVSSGRLVMRGLN